MEKIPDSERLKNIQMKEDLEARVHFLAAHVHSGFENLKKETNPEVSVPFFDLATGKSKDAAISAFLHAYFSNPARPHLSSSDLKGQVREMYKKTPSGLNSKDKLACVEYVPLQRVHRIALYLAFLAFLHPQFEKNVLCSYVS